MLLKRIGKMKIVALDEQNKCLRFETFGCLTTDGSSPKHNNRVVEQSKNVEKGGEHDV